MEINRAPHGTLRWRVEIVSGVYNPLMPERRFPPPWTFEEANHACFIVRDANNFAVAYVYFESEPGRRAAAHLMTRRGEADSGEYRQAAGSS